MGAFDNILNANSNIYNPGTSFTSAVTNPDDNDTVIQKAINNTATRLYNTESAIGYELNSLGDKEKYESIGLKPSVELLRAQREGNLEKVLADSQSNWQKTRNALAQTLVNEVGLGTAKGITDLYDLIINAAYAVQGKDDVYENPISAYIRGLQDTFEQEVAPVYVDPTRNTMADEGLGNWGWWMSNMPSIMSSLTLMIPGEGITAGLSKLGTLAKAGKLGKTLRKASTLSRRAVGITNAERLENATKIGISATTSRMLENHQEAMQVHQDMYQDAFDTLSNMSNEEYSAWVDRHKSEFGDNFDMSDKDAIAKHIARKAATETFMDDMWNVVFDVGQLYALKNIGRIANAPSRPSVREAHKNSIKYLGKLKGEQQELLAKRTFGEKTVDFIDKWAYGGRTAIGSELSEGIEEAVNYISQQEGMHLGNVILEKEQDSDFLNYRLKEYMLAPELWDSAVWGVLGGVVFQGLGSEFEKGKNALMSKTDKTYEKNKKTGEQIKKPSWVSRWELPEVKRGLEHIEHRTAAYNTYVSQIQQIYNDNVNPFQTDENGNPIKFEEGDDISKDINARKAFNGMVQGMLLDAIDSGTYNLDKEFLTSDNVINALVEAGHVDGKNAQEIKQTIEDTADRIEELYNKNLSAIDNALRGIDRRSGADYSDIPLDYIKIIARSNIVHQLNADSFDKDAQQVESEIERLQKQFPEAEKYRNNVEHLVNVLDYITKVNQLEKFEADKSNNTIVKENAIASLKAQIKNLESYISRDISGTDTNVSRLSRFISAYGRGILSRYNVYPEDHPRRRELAKQFRDFDNAILSGNIDTLKKFNETFNLLDDGDAGLEQLKSAASMAKVLNQDLENNVDLKTVYKELSNINEQLGIYYWQASALRNAAIMEAANIDLTRDAILKRIDWVHNQQNINRAMMIEGANQTLLSLAKQYGYDTIIKYVNDRFIDNKGEGFTDLNANATINNLSDKHKRLLDEALDILNLSEIQNVNVADKIKNILENAAAIDYATIKTFDEIASEEQGESSTGNLNPSESNQNSNVNNPPSQGVNPNTQSKRGENSEFSTDVNGRKLPKLSARVNISNDGKVSLSQIDLDNPNDNDYNIIINDDGDIELDLSDVPFSNPIFDNDDIINKNGNTTLDENVSVTKNPILTDNEDRTYKVLEKGQLKKDNEENGSQGANPSTGGLTNESNVTAPSISEEQNNAANIAEEQALVNANYVPEDVRPKLPPLIINYFRTNKEYSEDRMKQYLLDNIKDASQEEILDAFETFKDWAIECAKDIGIPIINEATSTIIVNSDILDEDNEDSVKESAKTAMNNAMETILNEYLKYGALDEVNGKYYINLANLLAYLNKATGNPYTANVIYDSIVKIISNNSKKYKVVDFNDTKSERLQKANGTQKQYEDYESDGTIHKLNSSALLTYMKKNLSEEEYEKERNKIYEALDSAKEGDKLDYKIDNNRLDIYFNNTKIGSFPIPKITADGNFYTMVNKGWKVDVPVNGTFTDSKFYNMLYNLFVNPDNDENVNVVAERLLRYIHRNKQTDTSPKFDEAIEDLIKDLLAIDNSYEELFSNVNNTGEVEYSNKDRVDHLAKLFNYVKQVGARKGIEDMDVAKKQQYVDLKDAREYSIQEWITKLKEESDVIRRIAEDSSLGIRIASINDSGIIKTTEQHPVRDAIGEAHKGKVHIATTVLGDNSTLAVAGAEPISVIGEYAGRTKLVIYSKKPWMVNAYPVSFNSPNLKDTEASKIVSEILEDLEKAFDNWGQKRTDDSFNNIIDLLSKLLVRRNGNQPLLRGIDINQASNGSITLHFNSYGKQDVYVNLRPTYNDNGKIKQVAQVGFKYGRNGTWMPSTSYRTNPEHKTRLMQLFNEYLSFNINPVYAQADNNLSAIHAGFASRNSDGKFVIKINEHEEHVFDSYNDFIIGQNTINVNTQHDENGRNLMLPTIKFEVTSVTTPVEESSTTTSESTLPRKGDEAIELINKNSKTAAGKILELALSTSQLKELKDSKIIKALTPKNTIFVEKWADGKDHVAALDKDGNLIIGKTFINLLNNQGSDASNRHLEAARNIMHEAIHAQLRKEDYKYLIPEIKEVFDIYQKIANTLSENDSRRRYLYENDTQEDGTRRYHNVDGSINLLGLEEFLVETITRPELMKLLNDYDTNGNLISTEDKEQYTPGKTTGNLFERILKALGRLFDIRFTKGSALEKELQIFGSIINSAPSISISSEISQDTSTNIEQISEEEKDIDIDEDFDDEDLYNPLSNFSDILDNAVTTPESVTLNMSPEEVTRFNNMLNNGLIKYSCKIL